MDGDPTTGLNGSGVKLFPNLPLPTTGGAQIWADELFYHGWHIQRNSLSGHYRLLDQHQVRHAWGSFTQCRKRLDEIRRERELPPMQGKAVIALHGMFRNTGPLLGMARFLRATGEYTVFTPTYPSNWSSIRQSAATWRDCWRIWRGSKRSTSSVIAWAIS